MSTRLSVIIPGYNTPDAWWDRCLRSVLPACGDSDEIICVDDGSVTKPCPKVSDSRIRFICLDKNVGQSAARNRVLDEAKGDYVAFVDSDDEVLPGIYEKSINALHDSNADIALFGVRVLWTDECLMKEDVPDELLPRRLSMDDVQALFKSCLFEYPVNRVFRKSFLVDNGIRFDAGICPGEDTVFNLKTVLAGARFCFVPEIGYIYYRTYTSSLARYQERFDDSLRLRNEYWRQVNMKLGVPAGGKMFGVLSNAELLSWAIENIWRFDAPLSSCARYQFLVANREHLPCAPWLVFLRAEIKRWFRRYLYVRPVRRFKAKRMFPNVKEVA